VVTTLDWIGLAFVYAAFGKRKKLGEGGEERGDRGTIFKANGVLRVSIRNGPIVYKGLFGK
jgi:hypothetical protein